MNSDLLNFFNRRHDELLAAMRKSTGRSPATMGPAREGAATGFFNETLPPLVRIESGDVIDAHGSSSGQLDAVLLHQAVPSLALSPGRASAVMLAEAVIAVVEMKSHLRKQWNEVERTWQAVIPLQREKPMVQYGIAIDPNATAIPLVVLGLEGWKTEEAVRKNAMRLMNAFSEKRTLLECPLIWVANLDPPIFSALCGGEVLSRAYPEERRGAMIASLWCNLVEASRLTAFRPIPWSAYLQT